MPFNHTGSSEDIVDMVLLRLIEKLKQRKALQGDSNAKEETTLNPVTESVQELLPTNNSEESQISVDGNK